MAQVGLLSLLCKVGTEDMIDPIQWDKVMPQQRGRWQIISVSYILAWKIGSLLGHLEHLETDTYICKDL